MPTIKKLYTASGTAITAPTDSSLTGLNFEDILTTTSADYTVLDDDGYTTLLFSTGGSNRTCTLPTLAANENRVIKIKKIDSGTGTLIIDGEGSETIDGSTTKVLRKQYDEIVIQASATQWVIVGIYLVPPDSEVHVYNGALGHGSTSTCIRRFNDIGVNTGTSITYADSATLGATFTINEAGIYAISYNDARAAGSSAIGISKNSNQGTTSVSGISATHFVAYAESGSAGESSFVGQTLVLASGDVIRAHTDGLPGSLGDNKTRFRIVQVTRNI